MLEWNDFRVSYFYAGPSKGTLHTQLVTISIKKYFYMGIGVLRGLAVSGTILPLEKTDHRWWSVADLEGGVRGVRPP
jgi:hypothetical protein